MIGLSDRAPVRAPDYPQVFAILLLLCFVLQCAWLASKTQLSESERFLASPGPGYAGQTEHKPDPFEPQPLVLRIAQFPVRHGLVPTYDFVGAGYQHRFLLRIPFVAFGFALGASLWYVARRLYGSAGATFALALYCFSPWMVNASSRIVPVVLANWGFFGTIFLSIASAHTLYAADNAIFWHARWHRPILMGIALGIALSTEFTTWSAFPLAVGFLFYLVPGKRRLAALMLLFGAVIALIVFASTYAFAWKTAFEHLRVSVPFVTRQALADFFPAVFRSWKNASPAFLLMFVAALLASLVSRKSRWFGNTSALITAACTPLIWPGFSFPAVPFLFMFVGGVFADLLETPRRKLVLGIGIVLLLADVGFGLYHLATTHSF